LIRHPLYSAVICAAGRLVVGSSKLARPRGFAALAILFDAKARQEERWLRQQFPDYARYAQRVRRFVPWIY